MTARDLNHVRRGNFIWCLKIHEDKMERVVNQQGVIQKKATGGEERVNRYVVEGKERPALVLRADPACRDVLVWYTRTDSRNRKDGWIEVTHVTRPGGEKRAFLNPEGSEIRRIPRTDVWCPDRSQREIRTPDKAVVIGWLERGSKIPWHRI